MLYGPNTSQSRSSSWYNHNSRDEYCPFFVLLTEEAVLCFTILFTKKRNFNRHGLCYLPPPSRLNAKYATIMLTLLLVSSKVIILILTILSMLMLPSFSYQQVMLESHLFWEHLLLY